MNLLTKFWNTGLLEVGGRISAQVSGAVPFWQWLLGVLNRRNY